jgi:hypothetical protein
VRKKKKAKKLVRGRKRGCIVNEENNVFQVKAVRANGILQLVAPSRLHFIAFLETVTCFSLLQLAFSMF